MVALDYSTTSIDRTPGHDRQTQRSGGRTVWAFFQVVRHILSPWRRDWRLRWGARPEEPDPSLPGEDLIPNPTWGFTHAITIAASPEQVWPWIAQVGQGRGGFYTFERLENLFGCQLTNAEEILPEHQNPAVGDEIRLHPTSPPMNVAIVDPGRSLVLRGSPTDAAEPETDNIWAFHVRPEPNGNCRLIERGKTVHGSSLSDRLFFSTGLIEPVGFVMSREMLLGIKERAERAAHLTDS